jgi:hypothetical protein
MFGSIVNADQAGIVALKSVKRHNDYQVLDLFILSVSIVLGFLYRSIDTELLYAYLLRTRFIYSLP